MPRAKTTARRSQRNNHGSLDQVLIEAAMELFAAYGYKGASLSKIASAARVTKGALYWHFEDKEEFFIAVTERVVAEMSRAVRRQILVSTAEDYRKEFIDILATWADQTEQRPWVTRALMITTLQAQESAPRVALMLRDLTRNGTEWFRKVIELGKALGALKPELDSAWAAAQIYSGFMGAVMLWHLDRERFELRRDLVRQGNDFLKQWSEGSDGPVNGRRRANLSRGTQGGADKREEETWQTTTS